MGMAVAPSTAALALLRPPDAPENKCSILMPVELLLLLIKPYTNLTRSSVCAPLPIISHSNRFPRANETSVPQTWCSAPST